MKPNDLSYAMAFDASQPNIESPNQVNMNADWNNVTKVQPIYNFQSINLTPTQKFLLYGTSAVIIYFIFKKFYK